MRFAFLLSAAAFAAAATAQSVVIPNGLATAEGNSSTAYPWSRAAAVIHVQYCYDSTHFTNQGVNTPIMINRLKWRANSSVTATAGGTYSNVLVDISTAAVDQAALTTTFASNHGPDRANVHTGSVPVLPTPSVPTTSPLTPSIYYIDLPVTPFLYDPSSGSDLLIDVAFPAASWVGGTVAAVDCQTTGALVSRMYNLTSDTAATGTFQANVGLTVEVGYAPASGISANFTANVTAGPSPLAVTFTDQSFTSDPGGITGWAWDFDGDNVIDSNLQNPSHVYTACGDFNVSLTVTDASHPAATLTKTAYIKTDDIVASFTYALLAAPNFFQFTDTSTPAATAWDWDFNGDNITDSTLQNPVAQLPLCQSATVRLIATRNCKSDTTTQTAFLAPNSLTTLFAASNGGSSGWIVMLDVQVANPQGINICGFDHNTGTTALGTPFTANVYVTDGSYVGKDNNIALWRLVGTGAGTAKGDNQHSTTPLAMPVYLPFGNYGIAIQLNGASVRYTGTGTGGSQVLYSNSDLTVAVGAVRSTLFNNGSFFTIRQWNGTVHYDTVGSAATAGYGFFAPGCAGSLGITNLVHSNRPQLGNTLNVTANNLPLSVAILMVGFSNTTSTFGPLPLDATAFGAPGCFGRVSPDATAFLIGGGNTASWNFGVPNAAGLIGLLLFNQALVPDPGFNALGAVFSDATGMMIGN